MGALVEPLTRSPHEGWLQLRIALWPHGTREEHLAEMAEFVAHPSKYAQFIALDSKGQPLGFVEAAVRHDYVNGADTSPVAFLEGLYVVPEERGRGIGKQLVHAVCEWALGKGLSEVASDAAIENGLSHDVHRALGFEETERVVFFRKKLLHAP